MNVEVISITRDYNDCQQTYQYKSEVVLTKKQIHTPSHLIIIT